MEEKKLILRKPDEVVVRMYGQGFGDCFLLAFPRKKDGQKVDLENPSYVVIDSGVFYKTPGERARMQAVAKSIHVATEGTIDLLIATHEHQDHLSGFQYAKEDWKKIEVRRIWLAWTEDQKHPATQQYDHEKEALQLQVDMALKVAHRYREQDPTLARELQQVRALTEFAVGGKIRPPRRLSKLPDLVLDDFAKDPGKRFNPNVKTERDFCEPGQVRTVPGTAVDAYVLGPPTAEARLVQDFDAGEVYPEEEPNKEASNAEHQAALAALAKRLELAAASDRAERESIAAALRRRLSADADSEPLMDAGAPFRGTMSLPYAAARQHPFFRNRYFEGRSDRQIETDWLRGFGRLALQVDRVINNTSLVLAFRLPDQRVLLFAADAQVGNWLSWHEIQPRDWRRPEGGQVEHRPTAAELLARTVVYKVGHHGSHNATLKARGLEMMPDGLIAFIPTSRVFPQNQQHWDIPFPTLIEALERKSGGRLVFPHERSIAGSTNTEFEEMVKSESADEKFPPMQLRGKTIEEAVPLWRQVRI